MYRTIVVPLDGSPFAERALPYATSLARVSGARLVLVTAPDDEPIDIPDPHTGSYKTVDLAGRYLERVLMHLADRGVETSTEVSYLRPADAILRCAQDRGAGLIIMATHGRSGVRRLVFGSVADAVLRRAETPVVMVPPHDTLAWSSQSVPAGEELLPPFRVLVPLDGSDLALAALEPAQRLTDAFGGDLVLLRVAEPPHSLHRGDAGDALYDPAADLVHDRDYLKDVARTLRATRVLTVCAAGSPAELIESVAGEWGANAVAMATHGRSGLTRLVMGSVTSAALRRAGRPYLLVRSRAAHSEQLGEAEAKRASLVAAR
ncbi:MAG TPA: universal stress protein [Chloroflexota bacterium]|nr:universal stress protein [Chloroflexota bacterium]